MCGKGRGGERRAWVKCCVLRTLSVCQPAPCSRASITPSQRSTAGKQQDCPALPRALSAWRPQAQVTHPDLSATWSVSAGPQGSPRGQVPSGQEVCHSAAQVSSTGRSVVGGTIPGPGDPAPRHRAPARGCRGRTSGWVWAARASQGGPAPAGSCWKCRFSGPLHLLNLKH